jgi:hypothetical protein
MPITNCLASLPADNNILSSDFVDDVSKPRSKCFPSNDFRCSSDNSEAKTYASRITDKLSFLSLNVCGLRNRVKYPEFLQYVTQYDVLIFLESKTDELDAQFFEELFDDLDYSFVMLSRKYVSNYRSGGIAVAIRKSFSDSISYINNTGHSGLWFLANKQLTNYDSDILIGAVYVPPESSRFSSVDLFDDIERSLCELRSRYCNCDVLLFGDFNAYTQTNDDFVSFDDADSEFLLYSDAFHECNSQQALPRFSNDVHRLNNFGHRLLDLCKSQSILIFNGRLGNDAQIGKCTSNGCSVVDYVIGSPDLFSKVLEFEVNAFDAMFSDVHCPVSLSLKLEHVSNSVTESSISDQYDHVASLSEPKVKAWDESKVADFQYAINRVDVEKINAMLDDDELSVDRLNNEMTSLLISAAKCSMGVSKTKRSIRKNNRKWFNGECRKQRSMYFKAKHVCKRQPSLVNNDKLRKSSKLYKKTLKRAENEYMKKRNANLIKLKKTNSKEYWKTVYGKKKSECPISLEDMLNHFKALNMQENVTVNPDENNVSSENDPRLVTDSLNCPITVEEIEKAIKKLKNGKASGIDKLYNEYIKNSVPFLSTLYCKLFNKVLNDGIVPEDWLVGLILPIYKGKGDKNNCDNYRGITLLSCLGKLFTSILNNRLTDFIESNNLLSENQAGFRSSHSTLDHIFVLKTLIDIFKSRKQKLYCAFIDYRKAFDSIWRQGLWLKLSKEGVNGKVFKVIVNMYNQIKSCVFLNGEKSEYFFSFRGVRQGENLSPLLFSLYLNDLEDFMFKNGCLPLNTQFDGSMNQLTDYIKLLVLLYADDTVIVSSSVDGLNRALKLLHLYCLNWKLDVNPSKTKVLVFNSRIVKKDMFRYGDSYLDVIKSIKYLGIVLSSSGNFYQAKKHSFDQAQKAMFCLLRSARSLRLPVNVVLELFQTVVVPILLYGCEIWGYENLALLEKLQLKFLKYLFRLKKNTMSNLIYGETGLYPLSVLVKNRIVRFWTNLLLDSSKSKLSAIMYKVMFELNKQNGMNFPWLSFVKKVLVDTGYDSVWERQNFLDQRLLCKNIQTEIQNEFKRSWYDAIQVSNRCVYYKYYKSKFKKETYISVLPDEYVLALIRFRCSSHKLPIESGRFLGIERSERKCNDCDLGVLGDEFHFLLECPKHTDIRKEFIPNYFVEKKSVYYFCRLMSGSKKNLLRVAKFIKHSKLA